MSTTGESFVNVCGKEMKVSGQLVRTARLANEGFEFVENPKAVLCELREAAKRIDLFTFTQKATETSPKYDYSLEWDNFAALPVCTFEHWWAKQVDGKTRNM